MFQLSWKIYGFYLFEANKKKKKEKSLIIFSYGIRNLSSPQFLSLLSTNKKNVSQTFKKETDISLKLIYE